MTLTIENVLRLVTSEPGRPRLTWYGDGGERVELSGAVLENWVNKTTNLLVEEFDIGPGSHVHVDLPPHWRAIVWSFAVWRLGGCVELGAEPHEPVDLVVTDDPAATRHHAPVIAVALPALARRYGHALPAGALDAASAVMTYGDTLGYVPMLDLQAAAIGGEPPVRHAGLRSWSSAGRTVAEGSRVLVPTRDGDLGSALRQTLTVLANAGSVVLVAPSVAAELDTDAPRRDRLVASERVTATW